MWTVAIDADALVKFLNRNVLTLEKLAAVLDGEEPDDDLMLELVSKIHLSLAGMASHLKSEILRKRDAEHQTVDPSKGNREIPSRDSEDLPRGDGVRSPEAEVGVLRREALKATTHRNYGKARRRAKRRPRR